MRIIQRAVGQIELRRMPWALVVVALALTCVGALFITSAHSYTLGVKHLVFSGVGLVAFLCMTLFDYRHFAGVSLHLYILGVASLAALPFFGVTVNNARRWYDLGVVHMQPSEPMKLLLIIALAEYFAYRRESHGLRSIIPPLILTLVPMLLIARQPDFGTAMMLAPVFAVMAFIGKVRLRTLGILSAAGVILLAAVWFAPGVLKPYQRSRLKSFIDPKANPHSSASYNARQATLAISSGGLHGQGWARGRLNRLGRIPERHTDFIFPVIAEEWGFWKSSLVISLYLVIIALLARITMQSRDRFGKLIAGGVLALFASQSLMHLAIALRLAPITGLTLPLVSYGGSSLVTIFAAFGLASSVAIRKSIVFSEDR